MKSHSDLNVILIWYFGNEIVVCMEFVTNILYYVTVCDARKKKLKSDNGNNIENMGWTMAISVHYFTINSGEHFYGKKRQMCKSKNKKTKKEIKFCKKWCKLMDFILKSLFKDNKLFWQSIYSYWTVVWHLRTFWRHFFALLNQSVIAIIGKSVLFW